MSNTSNTKGNTFTTFAVAGGVGGSGPISAGLGNLIARALLKTGGGRKVKVLAREDSASSQAAKELQSLGATIAPVDYASPSSLTSALADVDVVISALAGGGFAAQGALAEAAKKAGVKLFVPSEFGGITIADTLTDDSPLHAKTAFHAKLRELDLPYVLYFTGPFADWISKLSGPNDGKIIITGEGEKKISFTSLKDVTDFVAYTLTELPPSELNNRVFSISGSEASPIEIAKLYQEKDSSLVIEHESTETALKRFKEKGDFVAYLKALWEEKGGLSYREDLKKSNDVFPGFKPVDVRSFI